MWADLHFHIHYYDYVFCPYEARSYQHWIHYDKYTDRSNRSKTSYATKLHIIKTETPFHPNANMHTNVNNLVTGLQYTVRIFLHESAVGFIRDSRLVEAGGRFNNAYELLTLRALKISMFHKRFIFQCMGKIFCVEFQRYPLKFHTKYLTHTLKDMTFIQH